MMLINYLIFIGIIFFTNSFVLSMNPADIFDSYKVKLFISRLEKKVMDNQLKNTTLKKHEKNKELKAVFIDLINKLEKLNLASDNATDNYGPYNFYKFLTILEENQNKNGHVESFLNLTKYTKLIEEKSCAIDTIVRSLIYLRDKKNSVNVCSYASNLLKYVQHDKYFESILLIYRNFLRDLKTKMARPNQYSFCGKTSSFAIGLVNYYLHVMTSFIKKYTLVQFSKIIEAQCRNLQPTPSSDLDSLKINLVLVGYLNKQILQKTHRFMYNCDFKESDNKNHYYELKRLVQTIIIEERYLSTTRFCNHNCMLNYIQETLNHTECRQFINCQYMSAGFDICESNNGSSRRYEWFKDRQGKMYGGNIQQQCDNPLKSVFSYYNFYQLHHCDYCVCTCIANPQREYSMATAISFRDQVTNLENNEVVTGVRFAKKDRMIHVQIKKAKLKSQSIVGESSWKELENFSYERETGRTYVQNSEYISSQCKLGTDYGDADTLNFDDVHAPKGFVVTGVRFKFAHNFGNHSLPKKGLIQLQIRVTPFDYISGKLIDHNKTYWVTPEVEKWSQYNFLRKSLILHHPDKPTKSPGNVIDSDTNQYIVFRASDLIKDAGQSTVPFFEAEDVHGAPEFPLGGVGIIHRGHKGYGGFLAFRIFDLKLSQYFK